MPTVPPGSEAVAIEHGVGAGATVIESGWFAVLDAASLACTVKLHVCANEGVPEMVSAEDSRVSPAQSEPAVTLQDTGAVQLAVPTVCK